LKGAARRAEKAILHILAEPARELLKARIALNKLERTIKEIKNGRQQNEQH
jgi:hypothetical protein